MATSISFIHAADLHLDSPFKGLAHIPDYIFSDVRASTFKALDNLVLAAINKKVDFVLLAGDLFDNEHQSLKAQVYLRTAFERLKAHQIKVYLSYGNHDHMNGNVHPITYPDNVHIFPNEHITSFVFEKNDEKLASIYGFSYEERSLMKNKAIEYEVRDEAIPFHIALLHGSVHGNAEHDPYAPFYLQDLKKKAFDYWALGHIHKREILAESPPVVYPGNVQGRHRNEAGEKGCYYVQMTSSGVDMEFIPLHSILFESRTIDVTPCKTIYEIEKAISSETKSNSCKRLLHLTLHSRTENVLRFKEDGTLEELIELLNEVSILKDEWSYIYACRVEMDERPLLERDDFFIGELAAALDELSVSDAAKDLLTHKEARKFLDDLPQEKIKESAKQLLIYELLKG